MKMKTCCLINRRQLARNRSMAWLDSQIKQRIPIDFTRQITHRYHLIKKLATQALLQRISIKIHRSLGMKIKRETRNSLRVGLTLSKSENNRKMLNS